MCENNEVKVVEGMEKLKFTQSKVIEFDKNWIIEEFRNVEHDHESPIFSIGQSEKLQWRLKLYSRILGNNRVCYPGLTLRPCNMSSMVVRYTCYILDASDNVMMTSATQSLDKPVSATEITEYAGQESSKGLNYFFASHEIQNRRLLLNGKLSLFFEVQLSIPCVESDPEIPLLMPFLTHCDLSDNIGNLLKNPEFSDFTINVGGQEFLVHKNLLSARSPVFQAMLQNEMLEKQNNRVDLTDIEPEVFEEMLLFMYTGKVPNLRKMADKLLAVAEKYELPRLKIMSEKALLSSTTIDNVANMLILAKLYNSDYLIKRTARFISSSNLSTFLKTDGFQSLIESCPTAMADILIAVGESESFI